MDAGWREGAWAMRRETHLYGENGVDGHDEKHDEERVEHRLDGHHQRGDDPPKGREAPEQSQHAKSTEESQGVEAWVAVVHGMTNQQKQEKAQAARAPKCVQTPACNFAPMRMCCEHASSGRQGAYWGHTWDVVKEPTEDGDKDDNRVEDVPAVLDKEPEPGRGSL